MLRNYLKGVEGDMINTILVAVAYNMKKCMRLEKQKLFDLIFSWISRSLIVAR